MIISPTFLLSAEQFYCSKKLKTFNCAMFHDFAPNVIFNNWKKRMASKL
jgi:hypothetical protein